MFFCLNGGGKKFFLFFNVEILDLIKGLDLGLFIMVDLVNVYIVWINEVNLIFKVVIQINFDVLFIVVDLDVVWVVGDKKGFFYGILILLKDSIGIFDKMENIVGLYVFVGVKVLEDSIVVVKFWKVGVVILGKVNMFQWVNFRSFNLSNGWFLIGG